MHENINIFITDSCGDRYTVLDKVDAGTAHGFVFSREYAGENQFSVGRFGLL
jgi:hypothetical protein